ncbi:MAG: TonB-dependent receptor, partial [Pseudomonadota bacterium]
VVQLVSRLPEFDGDGNSIRRDIAIGIDSANLQKSVRGTVDFGNRALAASVSAGYLETGDRRVGDGTRIKPSNFESRSFRAVVRGQPDNRRRWYFDTQFLEQPETPRVDELVPGFGQSEPSSEEFFFSPSARSFAHFRYEHEAGWFDADWRFDTAWQRIDDDRSSRDLGSNERRLENNRSDLFGLTLSASGGNERSWITGVDFYYDEVSSARFSQDVSTGTMTEIAARFPDGSTVTQGAVFASMDWHGATRITFTGGLRLSSASIDLPASFGGEHIDVSRLSGDLGWLYDLSAGWRLVANVGVGFRAPNIFDLGTLGDRPGNRFNVPNTNLDVEEALHSDIGVRFRGERVEFDFAIFALRYDNRITSVGTGDVTPGGRDIVQSVNAADAQLRGAELGINVALSDALRIESLLNYVRGEQAVGNVVEPADRVPPLNGRVSLFVDHSDRITWSARIQGAAAQDRLAARDIRDVRIDPNGTPGWIIASLSADWHNDHGWHLTAAVENLFDKRFRQHGSGIDAAGRNVSLTVRRKW